MAHLNGSLDGCCWAILSVVQFLSSFVNNRIAIFPLPEKAILVTQSFMCLHDKLYKTDHVQIPHTKR